MPSERGERAALFSSRRPCCCLTWLEDLIAFVAARGELLVVALAAVQLFVLATERLVDERRLAHRAEEALLMPVSIVVGEILVEHARVVAILVRPRALTFDSVPIFLRHSSHVLAKRSS